MEESTKLFLDQTELIEMTERERPSAQRKILNALGVDYKILPNGKLKVLREVALKAFGGGTVKGKTKVLQPNWDALNA